jgi:hypothetical protein
MGGMASSVNQAVDTARTSSSGIFGGAAGAPPTDTARGLPMADGFGGGSMTPQAAPPPQNPIGIGPPADMVRPAPQQISPVVQQMMMRQQQPMFNPFMQRMQMPMFNPQMQGLQQLYSMFNRPQLPMMRGPMQMPVYRAPAQSYRPNIQQVQQNLSRVKPSVYKTDLDAARARIAELEGQLQPQDTGYWSGGG